MRTEKDSLGELEIEDDAYYGIQSFRAKNNFSISGTQVHPELIRSYLLLKKAAAFSNQKIKALAPDKAQAIMDAVDNILAKENILKDSEFFFIVDAYQAGAGTSQNMNINEVIANVANELKGHKRGSYAFIHPNDHVNMSQSTNDTYPTAMRLATLTLSNKLIFELTLVSSQLDSLAKQFDHILKAGRTHLQDAVPIRLGQEFSAYKTTVDQLRDLFIHSQNSLRDLGIGGSAVGSGINVPHGFKEVVIEKLRELFSDRELKLAPNMFASMQSQLPMMIYSNALRAASLEFTRIMNDLRLLSSGPSCGLHEIILPDTQPGSSIMPGKINPSILEMGNQVFFKIIGNDNAMAFALQAGQLELNVMMPLMAQLTLESTHIMTHALHSIREHCLNGIRANEKQCEKYVGLSSQIVTAISPVIGYARSAELAKEALSKDQSIIDLIREKNILSREQFDKVLNLREMTEAH